MNRYKDKKLQQNQPFKKQGRPIHEIIPPLPIDKKPREIIFTKLEINNDDNKNNNNDNNKDEINKEDKQYECFSEPNQVLPEWPGNEVANVIF